MRKKEKAQIATARSDAVGAKEDVKELKQEFKEYRRKIALNKKLYKAGWGLFLFVASLSSDFLCRILQGTRWFSFTYHKGFGWVTIVIFITGVALIVWGVWKIDRFYRKEE